MYVWLPKPRVRLISRRVEAARKDRLPHIQTASISCLRYFVLRSIRQVKIATRIAKHISFAFDYNCCLTVILHRGSTKPSQPPAASAIVRVCAFWDLLVFFYCVCGFTNKKPQQQLFVRSVYSVFCDCCAVLKCMNPAVWSCQARFGHRKLEFCSLISLYLSLCLRQAALSEWSSSKFVPGISFGLSVGVSTIGAIERVYEHRHGGWINIPSYAAAGVLNAIGVQKPIGDRKKPVPGITASTVYCKSILKVNVYWFCF